MTEKKFGREFWYLLVQHAAVMLNQFPVWLGITLITPFELIHNSKTDSKTWFELFSIGYFNHDTYNSGSSSKLQAHTLDGIAVGRDDRSNSIIFYNPITSSYYRPPAFQIDESRLPITNFHHSLCFDGSLIWGLLRNKTDPIQEPFPPGTRVSIQHNDTPARGTIKNIPIPVFPILTTAASPSIEHLEHDSMTSYEKKSPPYVILLDSGTTVTRSYDELIKDSIDDTSPPKSPSNAAALEGIPHFPRHDSKVTIYHKGVFHKGYINYSPESGFQFIFRRDARSRKVDFSVPLPDFKQHWTTLLGDERLFPGHSTVSSFLKFTTSDKNAPSLKLCICQTPSIPMSTLSQQIPRSLKPSPTILAGLIQWIKTRSYRSWHLQENL